MRLLRILAAALALVFSRTAPAQVFELRGADLRVIGDATWSGGGWGGYHPIRLEITNFGPGREVEARFEPHERGEGVPAVRRRVRVEQNATARVTLSVPLVGGSSGRLEFAVDGEEVDALRRDLGLMPRSGGTPLPSLLVISPDAVDTGGFRLASATEPTGWNAGGVPQSHVMGGGMGGDVRHAVVGPRLLPASWVDYTAVDLIAIRIDTLAALRPDERGALLDWTTAGGRLIVYGAGAVPGESEELRKLIGPAAAAGWRPADPSDRRPVPNVFSANAFSADGMPVPNEGNPVPFPGPAGAAFEAFAPQIGQILAGQDGGPGDGQPTSESVESAWPARPEAFAVQPLGFGHVAAVAGDAFEGTGADWAWLLRALYGPMTAWPVRHGMTSGGGDIEFINLPIPGVRGVPALAFLSLITVFAIAIGPVNYFLLWRKKRLSRLVLTVPAAAAATSVLLFGYAAVAHGFGTKGRVRSVTLVDPAGNTATSVSRVSVFSGLAPSRGLSFSKETAVYPMLPYGQRFTDGEVDWTATQGLTAGWLKTRTRTQFVTVTRRDERGRLTVAPGPGGLRVVNGFSVPFRFLVVTGVDGRAYFGRSVAAGGEATLRPLAEEDWAQVREWASDRAPEPPEGVEPDEILAGLRGRPWAWFRQDWKPDFRYGLLERHLDRLSGLPPEPQADAGPRPGEGVRVEAAADADVADPIAGPRGFLAVAEGDPGVDLGGLDVDERDSLHVLMGNW